MPPILPSCPAVSHGIKLYMKRRTDASENVIQVKNGPLSKRKADESPPKKPVTKRPALINVTNNGKSFKVQNTAKNEKTLPLKKDTSVAGLDTRVKLKTRLSENKTTIVKNVPDENKITATKQNANKKPAETSRRVDAMMPVLKNLTNVKNTKLCNTVNDGKKTTVSKPKEQLSLPSNVLALKPRTTRSSLATGVKLPTTTKNKSQKDTATVVSLATITESKVPCHESNSRSTRVQSRLNTSIVAAENKVKQASAPKKQSDELNTSLTRMSTRLSTSTAAVENKVKLAAARKKPCDKSDTNATRMQTRLSTSIVENNAKLATAREESCGELDTSLTRMQTRLSTSIAENKAKLAAAAHEEPCTSSTRMQTRLSTSNAANKVKQAVEAYVQKNSIKGKENRPSIGENRMVTRLSVRKSLADKSLTSGSLYMSALEDPADQSIEKKEKTAREKLLDSLSEFDKELVNDPLQVSLYAMEIFEYLKSREANFRVSDYMKRQPDITAQMRAMLVNWMAEIQENFELNHETLYLAVKLVDLYLDRVKIDRTSLQLLGAAAVFLACKYDERLSPAMDDFVYVSDGAYDHEGLLEMEQRILRTVDYELSIPISYSFLRRYARCARIQMPLLTLARFILELGLMSYKTIMLSDSKQAAAALYLARRMKNNNPGWNESLVYYTGYQLSDFKDIVKLFNKILHEETSEDLKSIRTKYSHKVFFHVAETPLLKNEDLDLDS